MTKLDLPTLLRSDVGAWNSWRRDHPTRRPELVEASLPEGRLAGADLRNALLREADLSFADLQGADLGGADLSGADLHGADLRGAMLSRTDLSGAVLTRANLAGASLRGTLFDRTQLGGAVFTAATFAFAVLVDLDLRGAVGLAKARHSAPSRIGIDTLFRSAGKIPKGFLRDAGVPESLISQLPGLTIPAEYHSCFISYNRRDRKFAELLHRALTRRGVPCWIDSQGVLPGQDILAACVGGIRLQDKMLLCCSRESLHSGWVLTEIDSALEKERRLLRDHGTEVLTLVPLALDGYLERWDNPRAVLLRNRFAEDFTGWRRRGNLDPRKVERIVRALRNAPGAAA